MRHAAERAVEFAESPRPGKSSCRMSTFQRPPMISMAVSTGQPTTFFAIQVFRFVQSALATFLRSFETSLEVTR